MRPLPRPALFFLFVSLSLFAQEGRGPGGRGGAPPTPPKNLKVLPADVNIQRTMAGIRTALGVQCNYCHGPANAGRGGGRGAAIDFASDENPHKLIARNMMHMMDDINAGFPDGKAHVTCYTCHRGESKPRMDPPADPAQKPAAK